VGIIGGTGARARGDGDVDAAPPKASATTLAEEAVLERCLDGAPAEPLVADHDDGAAAPCQPSAGTLGSQYIALNLTWPPTTATP
jgi:hypothetical protein